MYQEELHLVRMEMENLPTVEVYLTYTQIQEISNDPAKYQEYYLKATEDSDQQTNKENEGQPKNGTKWTRESIKLLIHLRLEIENKFASPTCKKNKLWQDIAKKMTDIGGYEINGFDCDLKYRNLLATYRSNKEKKKTTGEGKILWEFFEQFDSVLGHKASSCPPPSILTPSVSQSISKKENEKINKPVKNKEMTMNQYLKHKKDLEEKKWEERKMLKKEEIKAINALADAIKFSSNPGTSGQQKNPQKRRRSKSESSDSD